MNITVSLASHKRGVRNLNLRVLFCDDVKKDVIFGLLSIKYNLLPILDEHIPNAAKYAPTKKREKRIARATE